mmetsp:Transcript_50599/g.118181  ORF Transcript_50599/g.118181 Transcript_50599/m.118181 type:complete len:250 (-) Transcript_50599:886-1635(-)
MNFITLAFIKDSGLSINRHQSHTRTPHPRALQPWQRLSTLQVCSQRLMVLPLLCLPACYTQLQLCYSLADFQRQTVHHQQLQRQSHTQLQPCWIWAGSRKLMGCCRQWLLKPHNHFQLCCSVADSQRLTDCCQRLLQQSHSQLPPCWSWVDSQRPTGWCQRWLLRPHSHSQPCCSVVGFRRRMDPQQHAHWIHNCPPQPHDLSVGSQTQMERLKLGPPQFHNLRLLWTAVARSRTQIVCLLVKLMQTHL